MLYIFFTFPQLVWGVRRREMCGMRRKNGRMRRSLELEMEMEGPEATDILETSWRTAAAGNNYLLRRFLYHLPSSCFLYLFSSSSSCTTLKIWNNYVRFSKKWYLKKGNNKKTYKWNEDIDLILPNKREKTKRKLQNQKVLIFKFKITEYGN